jgi:predicted 2-oxoglutarate/Fe(II)-dependent dioxygenase YbiX
MLGSLTEMDTILGQSVGNPVTPQPVPDIAHGDVVVLRNVLTPEECAAIIRVAEERGFEKAALYNNHFSDVRKSQRCIVDSEVFVGALWPRLQHAVPPKWGWQFVLDSQHPLNERLRILRYDPGDYFLPHRDGQYMSDSSGSISQITILLYLNEGYRGGYTEFKTTAGDWCPVVTGVGDVVLMDQTVSHHVPALLEGVKYSLRTEVMYKGL